MNLNLGLEELENTYLIEDHKEPTSEVMPSLYKEEHTGIISDIIDLRSQIMDLKEYIEPTLQSKTISCYDAKNIESKFVNIWPSNFIPEQLTKTPSSLGYISAISILEETIQKLNTQYIEKVSELIKTLKAKHLKALKLLSNGKYVYIITDALHGITEAYKDVIKKDSHPNSNWFDANNNLTDIVNTPIISLLDKGLQIQNIKTNECINSFEKGVNGISGIITKNNSNGLLIQLIADVIKYDGIDDSIIIPTLSFNHLFRFVRSNYTAVVLNTISNDICSQIENTNYDTNFFMHIEANERGLIGFSNLLADILAISLALEECMPVLQLTV